MIYADYNGSTPISKEVGEYLVKRITKGPFANPNSSHHLGRSILKAMENARSTCAWALGADPTQIVFNSGATEGITTVFHHLLDNAKQRGKDTFIISIIEHNATFNMARIYEQRGLNLKIIPIKADGVVDIDQLKLWIDQYKDKIAMVSVMAANNETGVIQPVEEIAKLTAPHQIPFFSDTTQYIGKLPFKFIESGIDYAVLSGHKIGALVGSGLLLLKDKSSFTPLIPGAGQEGGLRGGTQNYLGNETIAVALDSFIKNQDKIQLLQDKRDEFENKIKKEFPEVVIMGLEAPRIPGTTFIAYPGIVGQTVQIELESYDIFVSTSSACSDNNPKLPRGLEALGIDEAVGRGIIRIALNIYDPLENYDRIFEVLSSTYRKLSTIKCF